ncbi:DUF5392 family protein [Bacillus kwashiorkori]|uniref:DUF5392 family protein n=1 Tax=Bacillus kwashiorkori TaxID=1522318 RepID=UPI00078667AC|nr:DUF5392 family protein [Bacillus kwashiorkori]
MDNFLTTNSFPENIRKELETIQKLIFPLVRKTSRYMFWTFPLIGISVINLFYLLFIAKFNLSEMYVILIVYAILGSIGMALWKETRLNKKEIQNIGLRYIIERIKKSIHLSDERKGEYIRIVNEQPINAMESFVRFLQEEDRIGKNLDEEEDEE